MDDSIKPNFSASHKGHFQKAQNFVVFFRSQTHSYAYHLVSVRRHNQHVRSPIQGFFRCEGISFIPRVQQRSTFPRLPSQERQNYITSPRPVSTAPLAPVRGSGVGSKEHPTPLCLSVLPPHPKRVVPTHPQRVIPTTPLWVYRHTPCRYTDIPSGGTTDSPQGGTTENAKGVGRLPAEGRGNDISTFEQLSDRAFPTLRRTSSNSPPYF